MRKSAAICVTAVALGLAMFMPLKASAQGVSVYIGPGPDYAGYPAYAPGYPVAPAYPVTPAYPVAPAYPVYAEPYAYRYPTYGYAYPSYGYGRPYYGTYWGHERRVARRVDRRWRWD